jgi:D-glycerate 3-kinase
MRHINELYPQLLPKLIQKLDPIYKKKKILDIEDQWNIIKTAVLKCDWQRKVYGVNESNVEEVVYERLKLITGPDNWKKLEEIRVKKFDIPDDLTYRYFMYFVPTAKIINERAIEKRKTHPNKAYIVEMNSGQGGTKSTHVTYLKVFLEFLGNDKVVEWSTDKAYKTYRDLEKEKRKHPDIIKARGSPHTHDIPLLNEKMDDLENQRETTLPGYNKEAYDGKGERTPVKEWEYVPAGTKIVILEGAEAAIGPIPDEDLFKPTRERLLKKVEWEFDRDGKARRFYNEHAKDYVKTSNRADFVISLDIALWESWRNRDLQEKKLIKKTGKGMRPEELYPFKGRYALFRRNVLDVKKRADLVVKIHNFEVVNVTSKTINYISSMLA